jgi:hypothetical protein
VTSFTLQRRNNPEKPPFGAENKGKAVLSLTSYLCKFVTIVKAAKRAPDSISV